ncbi:MAG TPA: hypothetical protein VKV15_07030 [Bryobacteraceae bacterium]|nr:hypothetical protein [Bryobacteraceae bacterium]
MKVHQKHLLDKGKTAKLVDALQSLASEHPALTEDIRTEADYFATNAERIHDPVLRKQHLFVGPGAIDARCKTVFGPRSNARACSGWCEEPTPFWLCAAVISTGALRSIGRAAGRPDFISMSRTQGKTHTCNSPLDDAS